MTIPLTSILVDERLRKDYGDLDSLAESIKNVGLIQPIVLTANKDGTYKLVAGGRRLKALELSGHTQLHHGSTSTPDYPGFVFANELPAETQLEVELEENLRRKDIEWREQISTYCKLHRMWSTRAAVESRPWTQSDSASRIGYSRSYLTHCLHIEPMMNDESYKDCASITDAMKVYYKSVEDKLTAEMASRTFVQTVEPEPAPDYSDEPGIEQSVTSAPYDPPVINIPLSTMIRYGDCVEILKTLPADSIDHCVTDWPYAIDMNNLDQQNQGSDTSRVAATHDVFENLDLHAAVIPEIFRVLKPGSFFVTFMDIMHWNRTYELLVAEGFGVQRWPLVWHKTSPCSNQMAYVNFTKNFEIAIVARKGVATLTEVQGSSVFSCDRAEHSSNLFAKPTDLWSFIISAVSLRGQLILDPFAGEGSCPVTALSLGRKILAIEKDSTHWPYLVNNISAYYKAAFPNCIFS